MALTYSTLAPIGTPAPDFNLPGTDGKVYSLASFKAERALVVIFMCNHCPYVQAVLPRLIELQHDYKNRGARLIGINANDAVNYPGDSPENMKRLADERQLPFPYLFDATQETAKAYDAVCTPDIYVYGKERTLVYRGRLDDNWQDAGKVKQRDLRDAIDRTLAGREPLEKQTPSMGCSIKWKPS